jgi:dipeptidase E
MEKKLLLISNSTNAGEEYLLWPRMYIQEFLKRHGITEVLFIPYAGVNLCEDGLDASYNVYEDRVRNVFDTMGVRIRSIHNDANPVQSVHHAECIMVGGGNTFHLVKMMHETGIMHAIRKKVMDGTPFAGWSAGANVACPTMKTTNDMPIVEPASFECLDLVPFQINPHYLDANPAGHGGETREQRLAEFLVVNRSVTVVGLREGTLLEVNGDRITLQGSRPMRVFKYGEQPVEISPGGDIQFLLKC